MACLWLFDDVMMPPLREPMTITQLKRHMDRRFDRLERTKADKSDLRRFATKKDLRRFATKTDLGRFAIDIRRHFAVVAKDLEDKIQKVADGVAAVNAISLHVSHHGKGLDEHETRITALERNA